VPCGFRRQELATSAYNPELGLIYIPSIEGCNYIETVEQKDMADQGGPTKPRDRFAGGAPKTPEQSLRQHQSGRSDHRRDQGSIETHLCELCRSAGNRGKFDFPRPHGRQLQCLRRENAPGIVTFNVGTGINAPPISYAVNGKQYVARTGGSRQPQNIIPLAPELKNTSTASMLFVFSL